MRQTVIYLDYSANTPVDPAVLDVFVRTEQSFFGNPNSMHPAGSSAKDRFTEATETISNLLNIGTSEIIYTSGASEANNLAVKGIARARRNYGKHIISTALEHPSVSGPLTWLQEQGYEIDLVDIGRNGRIDTQHLKELLRDDTILIAVTAVDSELGVIQPIREISEIVHGSSNAYLHVDATQAIGKIPFSFEGIHTASLTAHKFYGLNGSGILFKRKDIVIDPLIHGGSGATLYRSGTPTLALAVSLGEALRCALGALPGRWNQVRLLNEPLRKALRHYHDVRINSPEDAVPHILNISVSGIKGTSMQRSLAEKGVCVSVKSACSVERTPSKAVFAVSKDRKNALSSWRISLSHLTTEKELIAFLELFEQCRKELTE